MRILPAFAATALAAVALAAGLQGGAANAVPTTSTAAATPAATSTPTPSATADAVTISVAPDNKGIVTEGGDLTTTVTVHNGTDQALDKGIVRFYLDRQTFSSRSQLESWFARSSSDTTDTLGAFMTSAEVPALAAGATASAIKVTIPSATLPLSGSDWGAKAFGARYSTGGSAVTETHSSIVYYPNDSFEATKLAIAVPLTVPASTSGLISSQALASYTSPNGILTQELESVRGKDVAIGIDPMILASIRILGNVAPPSAIVWLKRLENVPNETFSLAYADADISTLAQAGEDTLPAPIDFDAAIAAQEKAEPDSYVATTPAPGDDATATSRPGGDATADPGATPTTIPPTSTVPTTESLLDYPYTIKNVGWPLDSTVSSSDLGVFKSSSIDTTILSSANIRAAAHTTEDASSKVSGQAALVSDATLSSLIRSAVSDGSGEDWKSTVAQLSAEVATVTHERPSDARTLFVTVDRNWATTGTRLDQTLSALSQLPWAKATSMSAAMATSPTSVSLSSKSASDARVDALTPLVRADTDLNEFATALKQPELVTATERLRMLALSSTSWNTNPTGLSAEVAKVTASVTKTTGQVKVLEGSSINILGDRSSLPIVLQNETPSPAVVYLRVAPSNNYLSVEKNDLPVTIQANSLQRVTVPVQSVANGKVTITMTLTSPKGVAISTPTQVAINVQAGWETAITLVFAVAVVLLFGGGIYRSIRRRRRSKAARAAGEPGDGDDGDSDSGADTTAASTAPDAAALSDPDTTAHTTPGAPS
jgi:hypothetical protein